MRAANRRYGGHGGYGGRGARSLTVIGTALCLADRKSVV